MPSLNLSTIGQVAVPVRDIQRATAFYRDVLGMTYLFTAGNLAFFDCSGVRLMLDIPEDERFDHPASVIYYKVADIQAATAALKASHVRLEGEPHVIAEMPDHTLWMVFFYDPDENVLALMSEVAKTG